MLRLTLVFLVGYAVIVAALIAWRLTYPRPGMDWASVLAFVLASDLWRKLAPLVADRIAPSSTP